MSRNPKQQSSAHANWTPTRSTRRARIQRSTGSRARAKRVIDVGPPCRAPRSTGKTVSAAPSKQTRA
eukprot:7832624-Pyramimonas_sp.AAC.1